MSAPSGSQPVKLSLPLTYQQKLFEELRKEDELVILARGLGLMRLVTNLVHSYDAAGNNLLVIVGAEDRENAWIGEALAEHAAISNSPKARGLTVVNTDFTSVGAREKMYGQGGIFSITSRILVVDLLTGLLKPETITGLVVLHAERVVATSLEAFILRIYRQKNKAGFLKAFSDNPDPFSVGFSPLATMMRNMFLRKASLWPRFHMHVAGALEGKKKAEVIELEVPMTEAMRTMQHAVLECVEVSIHELKRTNAGSLDMDDWSLDSALLHNFDVSVRRQLDPNWHRVSWKTKQIVSDLTVLRTMLQSIVALDAVGFLQHLDTIHAAHSPPPGSTRQTQSPWLFLDAAQTMFDTARRRVYAASHRAAANSTDNNIDSLKPVLEEQPKWAVLAHVLDEIERDLYFEPALQLRDDSNGTILIMCADPNTCRQLRDYLQTMHIRPRTEKRVEEVADPDEDGPSAAFMMRRKLHNYLRWKREFARVSATLFSENQRAINGAVDPRLGGGSSARGGGGGRGPPNKRRRMRGGGNAGTMSGRMENGSIARYMEKPGEVAGLIAEIRLTEEEEAKLQQKPDLGGGLFAADPLENMDDYYRLYDMQDLVAIHAYDGDQDEHVLEEVKPKWIIMYEPDASFIRRIEVYRSSHNDRAVRVYFLFYGGSVEEQRYLSSVRREKDAFTKLIKERASMSIVMTTDAHSRAADNSNQDADAQEMFLRTVNTRIAGGGRLAATAQPPRVVVDVREFRSSLPSLLHGRGVVVVPCMLTVGDYVLSPNVCVERKSVADLISSFRDGRLYAQVDTMMRHYRNPMVLIEFDQNKSFTLEPFADHSAGGPGTNNYNNNNSNSSGGGGNSNNNSGGSVNGATDLQTKLVMLTLAFPKIRIIWSSSPYETAEIFERLKAQEPEPDPVKAVQIGLETGENEDGGVMVAGTGTQGAGGDAANRMGGGEGGRAFNAEPQEMLAAVPGVTAKNMGLITFGAENIKEVANMGAAELEPMVGREAAGKISGFFAKDLLEDTD